MARQPSDTIDTEIGAAIAAGDYYRALECLASSYLDSVFAYCLRMLHGDPGRAKDVTQQVFEEACKGIEAFRGDASTKTWLLAIARNQCLKEISVRERHGALLAVAHGADHALSGLASRKIVGDDSPGDGSACSHFGR